MTYGAEGRGKAITKNTSEEHSHCPIESHLTAADICMRGKSIVSFGWVYLLDFTACVFGMIESEG